MRIETACTEDYPELLLVWERSVRATHDFLAEPDILSLRPLILEHYFDAVELFCVRDRDEKILGFSGVAGGNLEMLFIAPDSRGQGIGTALWIAWASQGSTSTNRTHKPWDSTNTSASRS